MDYGVSLSLNSAFEGPCRETAGQSSCSGQSGADVAVGQTPCRGLGSGSEVLHTPGVPKHVCGTRLLLPGWKGLSDPAVVIAVPGPGGGIYG